MAARQRGSGRGSDTGLLVTRILLVMLLAAPAGVLAIAARGPAADQDTAAAQELLGVDYLRALQPLTAALLSAQADAVAGRAVNAAALSQAVAAMDEADASQGEVLGVRDRWLGLRATIRGLPGQGPAPAIYAAYREAGDLLLALYGRLQQTSRLATDPQADIVSLQRAVTVDLPQVDVGTGRYADLARADLGGDVPVAALADLRAQRQLAGVPGRDLVENLQSAVASTSSATLSGNLLSELDAMRQALDAVGSAADISGNRISSSDAATADTLRSQLVRSSAALSAKVLDALAELITQRRDEARSRMLRADLALGAAIVLALAFIVVDTVVWVRRRPGPDQDEPDGPGEPFAGRHGNPAVADVRQEWVGAAR